MHNPTEQISGVLVTSAASWAADALREGDVLTKIDGKSVSDDGQVTLRAGLSPDQPYLNY